MRTRTGITGPGPYGVVGRISASPAATCTVIVVAAIVGLGLDRYVGLAWQPVLGLCAWVILAGLLTRATPMERTQTLVVVAVATFFEIVGSIIWGVYVYRYDNLPMFVPPGHGMVYLFGLRLTQTGWGSRNRRLLVRVAVAGVVGWAVIGLTLLERVDVAGAIGAVVLAGFLVRGRQAATYAGVFLYVAFLELYGTAIGTWFWLEEVPGLGVPNGNPPSGIAGGYVFFDIAAIALAPAILARWRRFASGAPAPEHAAPAPEAPVVAPPAAPLAGPVLGEVGAEHA